MRTVALLTCTARRPVAVAGCASMNIHPTSLRNFPIFSVRYRDAASYVWQGEGLQPMRHSFAPEIDLSGVHCNTQNEIDELSRNKVRRLAEYVLCIITVS